jgi:hypothetical protein
VKNEQWYCHSGSVNIGQPQFLHFHIHAFSHLVKILAAKITPLAARTLPPP